MKTESENLRLDTKAIALKALIQASMFGLVILFILFLLNATQVLLVVYAGLLLAVLFHGLARWIAGKAKLPEKAALPIAILGPVAILGLGMWLMAPAVADQAGTLADRLPQAVDELKRQMMQHEWTSRLWENKERLQQALPRRPAQFGLLADVASSALNALGYLVVALFIGLFIAIDPRLYIDGALRLVPQHRRERARQILDATGSALRSWLVAKLTAMAVIGILTALGLWLLDIDLALVLGLIAALLSFIPNFGPIASVIPALLIALVSGPDKALYVLLLYAAIQAFESYGLTPLLQQHMIDLPPALLLTMQILFGVLAGVLGIILATPLTAAGMVLTRMWYVEDLLEHRNGG